MAEKKNEFPPGVEANRRLLAFDTWEDYLDSLIEIADLRNLRSINSARTIAAFGYRANGDTLSEKEFYSRRAAIHSIVFPVVRPYVLVSEGAKIEDPFFRELAVRERANRVGILQSVIFIRHFTKSGFEISGYIDYAHRLITEDWTPFFKSNKMLLPRDSDLGYYHWRHGTVRSNISRNYKEFAKHLLQMLYNEKKNQGDQVDSAGTVKVHTPKSLIRTNSAMTPSIDYKKQLSRMESNKNSNTIDYKRQLSRLESNKSSITASTPEIIGPLSNVCYAVFALGSSAYPKYCNFGKTMDRVLEELLGERLLELTCGDEMCGQEQQFRSWSSNIFQPLMDTERGLLFQNRHDHKIIFPDPRHDPGQNTTKQRVYTKRYTQIEIYDHVVRRKT